MIPGVGTIALNERTVTDVPGVRTTISPLTTAAPTPSTTALRQQTVLAKTGSTLRPMVLLSGLSLVLGVLLLVGSSRPVPVPASAGTWTTPAVTRPEKWGPMEIGRALWGAFAALMASAAKLITRRRPPRGRGRSG